MPTGRRVALAVAAGWLLVVLALYLAILRSQGDPADPAWWFVALLGGCAAVLATTAFGLGGRRLLVVTAVVLALGALAGLLTIGLLLVPAAATALVVAVLPRSALDGAARG